MQLACLIQDHITDRSRPTAIGMKDHGIIRCPVMLDVVRQREDPPQLVAVDMRDFPIKARPEGALDPAPDACGDKVVPTRIIGASVAAGHQMEEPDAAI